MPMEVSAVFIIIGIIAAMIYVYAVVMKEEKYAELHPFLQKLHDLFNFKELWLESILRFCYVFCTVSCVVTGLFLLVSYERGYYGNYSYFLPGLIVLLAGPIAIRLVYEASMMFILLVKNVMQINSRLAKTTAEVKAEAIVEKVEVAETVEVVENTEV